MSFPLYPNTTAGLAAVGPVQAMSDRNEAQTYMANGGQMFASGGIALLAEGGSTALPKYKYDPITQRYVLVEDEGKKEKAGLENLAAKTGSSSGPADYTPSAWDKMSLDQKAAYYAENPREAKVAHTLADLFKDYTLMGRAASYFDPIGTGERMASLRGVGLGPTGYMAQQNAQAERNAAQPGFDKNWGGGLRGTMGDQPGDYDGQGLGGYGTTGPGSASGIGVGSTEGINAMDAQSDAAAAAAAAADTGGYTGETYAYGGLASLARGGMSHLGDYSDGGRLLRGPGNGTSDSIPATIGDKRPARLADGEFVIPSRIVSELGNGSTEAGARQLYAMMDRIQKARSKTVGKNKVAVDAKARNQLPA